jgi:hypothetical protein
MIDSLKDLLCYFCYEMLVAVLIMKASSLCCFPCGDGGRIKKSPPFEGRAGVSLSEIDVIVLKLSQTCTQDPSSGWYVQDGVDAFGKPQRIT